MFTSIIVINACTDVCDQENNMAHCDQIPVVHTSAENVWLSRIV